MQLRQCLSGEALNVIESLEHSAAAYEAAKERLERRYGGKRRQVAIYLEDLEKFPQIRPGNAHDSEQFADLLEIAIMNLNETGYYYELGNGFLYGKLRSKLTESMLAKYHRWVFETQTPESVVALKAWVFHESEFQTIASEIVHGITGTFRNHQSSPVSPTCNSQRTFFGEMIDYHRINNTSCQICRRDHKIWTCAKCVSKRWDTAKHFNLCFRCLGDGHRGKLCPRSLPCGENGCQKLHHVLLHSDNDQQVKAKSKCRILSKSFPTKTCHNPREARRIVTDKLDRGTEGNDTTKTSLMETQDDYSADFSGLPTVPVAMTQGNRRCKNGKATIKQCTETGIALELDNRSKNMVSDRNCRLQPGDKLAHLASEENQQEIPLILMEGNFTTKCSRVQ